ncbi:MAG TPA: amino acid--[acyl-carrier-protein] ligase [Acidimicrobiales bacterium]|nr:amino acid--[acyl-carrier-protein] ligase [Acidimicrobiales bacterium]
MTSPPAEAFRAQLAEAGVVILTEADGVVGTSGTYELVVSALNELFHGLGEGQGESVVHFPPVYPRSTFERTEYLSGFSNLVGAVNCFTGADEDHDRLLASVAAGEDWSGHFSASGLMLQPAACHPVYPICTGVLPEGGRRFEVAGYCFRHEPSRDPFRMQSFRMFEHVYVGDLASAVAHRDRWVTIACDVLGALGLDVSTVPASDPFFGRAGSLLAEIQRDEASKLEVVFSLPGSGAVVALASGNWHQDHFGTAFAIQCANGETAQSACFGFGVDRVALALFAAHGVAPATWPAPVRARLWPNANGPASGN